MASSDEDLLPPPLLPIIKEGRGDKERAGGNLGLFGDDLRREHTHLAGESPLTSGITCEGSRQHAAELPPGYLQALLTKVRALGLISSRGVNAGAVKRSPPMPPEVDVRCRTIDGPDFDPGCGGARAGASSIPVPAPTLLFNAPTAFDLFALHHNPIVLAIRAYQFDLLQKQVEQTHSALQAYNP